MQMPTRTHRRLMPSERHVASDVGKRGRGAVRLGAAGSTAERCIPAGGLHALSARRTIGIGDFLNVRSQGCHPQLLQPNEAVVVGPDNVHPVPGHKSSDGMAQSPRRFERGGLESCTRRIRHADEDVAAFPALGCASDHGLTRDGSPARTIHDALHRSDVVARSMVGVPQTPAANWFLGRKAQRSETFLLEASRIAASQPDEHGIRAVRNCHDVVRFGRVERDSVGIQVEQSLLVHAARHSPARPLPVGKQFMTRRRAGPRQGS